MQCGTSSTWDTDATGKGRGPLVGVRADGGLDLAIVCSGPLGESDETLRRLYQKTVAYLREIESEKFRARFGASDSASIRILVDCEHVVSTAAEGLIKALARQVKSAYDYARDLCCNRTTCGWVPRHKMT